MKRPQHNKSRPKFTQSPEQLKIDNCLDLFCDLPEQVRQELAAQLQKAQRQLAQLRAERESPK